MARKAPKNPINDIVDTVGAWLGGNRGTINPQVQRVQRDLGTVAQTIDTFGTGGVGQALVSDAQRMAATGSSTPSALYKTAAVNLAAGATGYGAANVVGKAIQSGRVVNPAAAARNLVSGQRVVVHGSPKSSLTVLKPSTGSKTLPSDNVLFSWNPRKANMSNEIHRNAAYYANKAEDAGSIYVAKVPKRATTRHPKQTVRNSKKMLITRGEGQIVSEVPLRKPFQELSPAERKTVAKNVQAELRKAGVQPRGVPKAVDAALAKVDDVLWKAEYKLKKTLMTQAQKDRAAAARRARAR